MLSLWIFWISLWIFCLASLPSLAIPPMLSLWICISQQFIGFLYDFLPCQSAYTTSHWCFLVPVIKWTQNPREAETVQLSSNLVDISHIVKCSEFMEDHTRTRGPEDQKIRGPEAQTEDQKTQRPEDQRTDRGPEDQRQKGARKRNLVWRKVLLLFCQISCFSSKLNIYKHWKGKTPEERALHLSLKCCFWQKMSILHFGRSDFIFIEINCECARGEGI